MTFVHDNVDDLIGNFEYPRPTTRDPNLYALLGVTATENERLDLDIESLYDQRFLDSATGRELEKIGAEVGEDRQSGETDAHYRARIKAAYGALASDATFDDLAATARNTLDAGPSEISILSANETSEDKVVQLSVDGALFDNSPLTASELAEYLSDAVSADARVEIVVGGTFAFDGDNTSLKGFDDGTWSSTV